MNPSSLKSVPFNGGGNDLAGSPFLAAPNAGSASAHPASAGHAVDASVKVGGRRRRRSSSKSKSRRSQSASRRRRRR